MIAWLDEARRMRAEGATYGKIGKSLGVDPLEVGYQLTRERPGDTCPRCGQHHAWCDPSDGCAVRWLGATMLNVSGYLVREDGERIRAAEFISWHIAAQRDVASDGVNGR